MKRKTRISKSSKEPWSRSDIINSALAILTFVALVITGISTCISKNSLDLQQKQYSDYQKKDRLNAISDSIKNERYMELTQRQIDALQEQVAALNRGVRSTEVSQRPFVDIIQFGYHSADENNRYVLRYKVSNNGVRPLVLKKVKLYVLDEQFKFKKLIPTTHNHLIVRDMAVDQRLKSLKGNEMVSLVSKEDILTYSNAYYCFKIEYYDPFLKKSFNTNNTPIMFRWVNRKETDLFLSINGNVKYLGFESCSEVEETKILKELKRIKEK